MDESLGKIYKLNNIFNVDCLEFLKSIPDNIWDCVITDPPYGIGFKYSADTVNKDLKTKEGISNDNKDNFPFLSCVVKEISRTLKNNTHFYWFTRWDKLDHHLPLMRKYFKIKNMLVWDKKHSSMGDLTATYQESYEIILVMHKGRRELNEVDGTKRHRAILSDFVREMNSNSDNKIHDHQKPIDLLKLFVEKSTNKNEIVFDPFAGSGSTSIAAIMSGRRFVTTELDESIYKLAEARIQERKSKYYDKDRMMFDPPKRSQSRTLFEYA